MTVKALKLSTNAVESRRVLGSLLKNSRALKGVSQAQLAKQLNRTAQFLSNIERGTSRMPWEAVGPTADFLGVSRVMLAKAVLETGKDYQRYLEILKSTSPEVALAEASS